MRQRLPVLGIIDRYLLGEVIKVFLAIVLTLLLVVLSVLLLRTLEEVNVGALSFALVSRFLGLQLLRDSASILPPAFFLAALVTLSRLSRDSELIALHASGIGPLRLYRALLLLALPVALLTAVLSLLLQPWAASGIQQIRMEQKEQATQIAGLQPGRFYVENAGQVVVYIGAIDRQRALGDVFILDRRSGTTNLVASKGGGHRLDEESGDHLVTLTRGHRFEGNAGEGAFLISEFEEYRLRIRSDGSAPRISHKRATVPTSALHISEDRRDRTEFEHRLGAPLALFTLALLAVPLVHSSPRQSTSGRVLLALLAYFCFFNLQRLAEHWLESGVTPVWLGSLWYQVAILLAVHLLLLPGSTWPRRMLQGLTRRWRAQ